MRTKEANGGSSDRTSSQKRSEVRPFQNKLDLFHMKDSCTTFHLGKKENGYETTSNLEMKSP